MSVNKHSLKSKYTDPVFLERFRQLYAISVLLRSCFIETKYKPKQEYIKCISLSIEGEVLLEELQTIMPKIPREQLVLAIFVAFSYDELFIDVYKTDIKLMVDIVNSEILEGNVKYLWIYERLIYDQFSAIRTDRPRNITYEEFSSITLNMPTGVFQVSKYIVGPLGIIESSADRYLPPLSSAPMWHCADPACEQVHFVEVNSAQHGLLVISEKIKEVCANKTQSEWFLFFNTYLSGEPEWFDEKHFDDLPNLIINCFSESELRTIFTYLITKYPDIRSILPKAIMKLGSSEKIAASINKQEVFQLILILSNKQIIDSIEELIDLSSIHIPSTELRYSKFSYKRLSAYKITCQCSRFGIRSVSKNKNLSVIRLKNLVNELFKDEADLNWKLRHIEGDSTSDKLESYLMNSDPKTIISELILSSQYNITKTFEYLVCGNFSLPKNQVDESFLIEKILWKLGFDIGLYPNDLKIFWERLYKFRDVSKTYSSYLESDREEIRSAGVNFFVSMEQILDISLTFLTWSLFSDHYGSTEFKYSLKDARKFTARFLNHAQESSDVQIFYDENGKNTLFPLIKGFSIVSKEIRNVLESPETYQRSFKEYPGYFERSAVYIFPFKSTALLLDIQEQDIQKVIKLTEQISYVLDKDQICSIRNRIEHKRDDFPTQSQIETACTTIISIVREMQNVGVLPTIYLYSGKTSDKYGRGYESLMNFDGKVINIQTQSQYTRCKLPSLFEAQIIVPIMRIKGSIEYIRFGYEEDSEYVKMWRDFPKKAREESSKTTSQETLEMETIT